MAKLNPTEVIHRCEGAQVTLFQLNNPATFRLSTYDDGSVGCPACGLILEAGFGLPEESWGDVPGLRG